jgi:hypothetical protein
MDNMTRTLKCGAAWAGLAFAFLGLPADSNGASVSSLGLPLDLETIGPSNLLTLMTLQANLNESGAVTWNGSTHVRTGDATAQSFTRTTAELRGLGITGRSFGVVFSGNELPGGTSVNLSNFTLRFFAPDGSKLFDATYQAAPGQGTIPSFGSDNQTGWLYRVSLSDAEADLFFASDTNRIGVLIDRTPIGHSSGGSEAFSLLHFEIYCGPDGPGEVPEPASVLVWLAAGVFAVRQLRKPARSPKS